MIGVMILGLAFVFFGAEVLISGSYEVGRYGRSGARVAGTYARIVGLSASVLGLLMVFSPFLRALIESFRGDHDE